MNDIIEYDLISVITERVLRDNGIFDLVELTLKKNYHISIDQVLDYPENLKLVFLITELLKFAYLIEAL